MRDFFHTGLQVSRSDLENMLRMQYPGGVWYVSRNVGSISGDGRSWDQAYLTIGEAITAVNLAYSTAAFPTRGRNTLILIDEGWYSEPTMTLSAYDCTIMGVAPGNMGRTVLYGSLTADGWDDGNTGPALAITGWNNTIANMDFVNRSAATTYSGGVTTTKHPCILEGTFALGVGYNRFINLGFMRDQLDAAGLGILSFSQDHTLIEHCIFNGASLKEGGIGCPSMSGNNHSADIIRNNYFFGCPTGIFVPDTAHNTLIHDNHFTDQGAVTITMTNPVNIGAAATTLVYNNMALTVTLANMNGGSGGTFMRNMCSDTGAEDWPEPTNA